MRRSVVAGNWKMNGTRESIERLVPDILLGVAGGARSEVIVCVPYVYLDFVGRALEGSPIRLGAQNLSEHAAGAYTGEIAGAMLSDLGCSHVIVGHSERRTLYGEGDAVVALKFEAAREAGLTPILCIGETLEERERGEAHDVIARQLEALIAKGGAAGLSGAMLAYEPVWAIGTGKTATPDQAQEIHEFVRVRIAELAPDVARAVPILYGGSVKAANARELFSMPDIDGGLIGGASLVAEDFLEICHASE